MRVRQFVAIGTLTGASALVSGCAAWQRVSGAESAEPPGRYGASTEVLHTVSTVKSSGQLHLIGSRAIRLPEQPLDTISAYEYQYPEACGSYVFRVLESGETQILEYSHLRNDGMVFVIRDYVKGPHPFVGPGLWTSYDHTSDDIPAMMARYIESNSRVGPRTYSGGPVTGLATMTQQELGIAYSDALYRANHCQND